MAEQFETARRVTDNSNRQARHAVEATLGLFAAWRGDLASFGARSERCFTPDERRAMLTRCAEIADQVQGARTELILDLMDAPRRVVGHSRVADVEKALDGVEATLRAIEQQLAH